MEQMGKHTVRIAPSDMMPFGMSVDRAQRHDECLLLSEKYT
jgi:hypothetical protein